MIVQGPEGGRQVFQGKAIVFCQDNHALDQVLHFPDIAGPWVVDQKVEQFRSYHDRLVVALVALVQEMVKQYRDVVFSLPEWRQQNRHHVQAVIKIRPEVTPADFVLQADPDLVLDRLLILSGNDQERYFSIYL